MAIRTRRSNADWWLSVEVENARSGHSIYGTLKRATAHGACGRAALAFVGKRTITGTLYDLGAFPGYVPGRGTVAAELYRIRDPSILWRLDAFEGFVARAPQRSLFVRSTTHLPHGAPGRGALVAWIYVFNGPVAGHDEIRGGSWRDYRERPRRAVPYSGDHPHLPQRYSR
jgi:gamma-glutamylcyclotransferase (GGCT)/AIG2-like uncharacterized protein YtfP